MDTKNFKDRNMLRSYFLKNKIPTEANFADLINGTLNQFDDGICKPAGDPLSITATGDAATPQKLINFYGNSSDPNPAWLLQMNPRSDQNDSNSAKAGFSISDGEGNSRLFIDKASGKVGIGTIQPAPNSLLNIVGGALAVGPAPYRADAAIHVTGSFGGFARLLQMSPTGVSQPGLNLLASREAAGKEQWWTWGVTIDNTWRIRPGTDFNGQEGLSITVAGNVGIGTLGPDRQLTLATATGANYMNIKDGAHEILMGVDGAGGIVSVMSNHDLSFRAGANNEKMRITSSGAVGIGTSAPTTAAKLHVAGGALAVTQSPEDLAHADAAIHVRGSQGGFDRLLQMSQIAAGKPGLNLLSSTSSAGADQWWVWGTTVDHKWRIRAGTDFNGTDGLTITNSGNVGIGTSNPAGKLDIANLVRFGLDENGSGSKSISFARDTGDEGNAGKITYKGGFGDALHIVGSGAAPRKIKLWDDVEITGNLTIGGQFNKLDVADNFTAIVRCADFRIGNSTRHNGTGRALVDFTDTLHINYGPDWTNVQINGKVTTPSSRSLKDNIETLSSASAAAIIDTLLPVTFRYKTDPARSECLGFIAEDSPPQVTTDKQDCIIQNHIIAALVRVVKDQQAQIAKLDSRLGA